jgi:hypothetical protein
MDLKLESDTPKILIFIAILVALLFFMAIINTSFKNYDSYEENDKLQWGNKLLVVLVVFGFAYTAYSLHNLYIFFAALFLIIVMVV